ncbi:hypothetical protein M9Y10_043561 [Tritrichomonas musculus]|uniref:J domain-containing protein n=1 Tax=Tritrichomonas musculus TaxID=1915356 RepID=A0ABR2K168_9EUKA
MINCFIFFCIFGSSVDPNRLRRIEHLMAFHQFWNAYSDLTTIISQEPKPIDNKLYRLRAQCTLNMAMITECLHDCKKILNNSPSRDDKKFAYLITARAHIQVGEFDEAMESAIEAGDNQLQNNCDQLMRLVDNANSKYEEGQLGEAARILDTLLQNAPKAKDLILKRANIAFLSLDYNRFKQLTKDYEKEFSGDATFVYRRAVVTFCDGQMGAAMNGVRKAMSLRGAPKNCSATLKAIEKVNKHYPIAERFLQNNDIESAQRELNITKEASGNYCPADSVLIKQIKSFELKIMKAQHTPEELLEILNDMLDKDPNNVDFMLERGDVNLELKEYDAALFDYQNAQRHRPNDSRAQKGISKAQELKKKANYVDHYEILGIEKTATIVEIKTAYKKLVRQWHPDRYGDPAKKKEAEAKMKKINQAYDILGDEQKRRLYDSGQDPDAPNQGPNFDFNPFDLFFNHGGGGGGRTFQFGGGNGFHFEFRF